MTTRVMRLETIAVGMLCSLSMSAQIQHHEPMWTPDTGNHHAMVAELYHGGIFAQERAALPGPGGSGGLIVNCNDVAAMTSLICGLYALPPVTSPASVVCESVVAYEWAHCGQGSAPTEVGNGGWVMGLEPNNNGSASGEASEGDCNACMAWCPPGDGCDWASNDPAPGNSGPQQGFLSVPFIGRPQPAIAFPY